MKKKRFFVIYLLLAIALTAAAVFLCVNFHTISFHRLTGQFFAESLENDALTLHYTLADPEAYGISPKSSALPVYSAAAQEQSQKESARFLERLSFIRPEKLSETDRRTYELLSAYIKEELDGSAFAFYEEPLSPSSGMHTELPLLLAEYTFRTQTDVDNYLKLLASVPAYLEGLTVYETQKAQAGLFMPEEDAFSAAAQCDQLFSEELLKKDSHFLQTTFADRLENLVSEQQITQQQQAQYIAENNRLLTTVVVPAYQELGDALIILSKNSSEKGGLCQFPEGKEYYAWLLKNTTGCSLAPAELYSLLQKKLHQDYKRLLTLTEQYQSLTGNTPDFSLLSNAFSTTEPASILSDLQSQMSKDFPSLSVLTEEEIGCTIKDVDESLESFTSPAYYMTPPADDLLHNTICVNRSSTAEGVELYTTLAHEGYPGHLYQTVYSSLTAAAENTSPWPVRELLYYGGYTEGWAYYAERLSYTYAARLLARDLKNTGALTDAEADTSAALLCELAAIQMDLQVNLFCMLDISLQSCCSPWQLSALKTIPLNGSAITCAPLRLLI